MKDHIYRLYVFSRVLQTYFRDMNYFAERILGFAFLNHCQYSIPKHWLDWC